MYVYLGSDRFFSHSHDGIPLCYDDLGGEERDRGTSSSTLDNMFIVDPVRPRIIVSIFLQLRLLIMVGLLA